MQKKNTTYIADSMFAMSEDSLDVMQNKTVMKLNRISFFSFSPTHRPLNRLTDTNAVHNKTVTHCIIHQLFTGSDNMP